MTKPCPVWERSLCWLALRLHVQQKLLSNLLGLQGQGQQSIAAELAFQQHLAKQLGLKGKNKTKAKGPDDGLDDLLEGAVSCSVFLLT